MSNLEIGHVRPCSLIVSFCICLFYYRMCSLFLAWYLFPVLCKHYMSYILLRSCQPWDVLDIYCNIFFRPSPLQDIKLLFLRLHFLLKSFHSFPFSLDFLLMSRQARHVLLHTFLKIRTYKLTCVFYLLS